MSPLMVIDALSTSLTCSLGDVRSYLSSVLRTEHEQTQADTKLTEKYRLDTEELRKEIEKIKSSTIIFQSSRCSACNQDLELPSVHFMCQHSYHQQLVAFFLSFYICKTILVRQLIWNLLLLFLFANNLFCLQIIHGNLISLRNLNY